MGIQIGYSQTKKPFYEQIAFDYFRTEILVKKPENKKIRIYEKLLTFSEEKKRYLWTPNCLKKFEINKKAELKINLSGKTKLNLVNLNNKIFKIKKNGKGAYPKLYVAESISNKPNQIIVSIHILYKFSDHNYRIEMNKEGEIINWCERGTVY